MSASHLGPFALDGGVWWFRPAVCVCVCDRLVRRGLRCWDLLTEVPETTVFFLFFDTVAPRRLGRLD